MSSGICMNPKCNGTDYLCGKCRKLYPASAAAIDERKRQKNANRGGTMNSSNFKSKPQRNNPNVTNHYFNGPGDGKNHGHVKEHRNTDGSNSYLYARDVEGNEYKTKK